MKRSELEHLIRAAAAVTNQVEIVVVGSQSVRHDQPTIRDCFPKARRIDL